jgi:hypothetical protein
LAQLLLDACALRWAQLRSDADGQREEKQRGSRTRAHEFNGER